MPYLPGINGSFKVCTIGFPSFKICRVYTTHLKGIDCAGYLLRPELVQFHVTLFNLSQQLVHFAEQGIVLWKRPRKC